jgi:hypothetical protein
MIVLALVGAAVAALAGCGGSDEPEGTGLPQDTASELERRLDEIERRYRVATDDGEPGACADIENDSIPAVNELVDGLPQDVDPDIRQAVEESFSRLEELTRADCAEVEPAETEPETVPAPTETIPETTPEETTTETTPEEAPKEEKPKKDKGGDKGGGAEPTPVDPTAPGQGGGALPGAGGEG